MCTSLVYRDTVAKASIGRASEPAVDLLYKQLASAAGALSSRHYFLANASVGKDTFGTVTSVA